MPRTKLGEKYSPKDPPIDWLRAAVLERKAVKRLDLKTMAKMSCVSYERMRNLILQSPWDWPREIRERVCKSLGINLTITPDGLKIGGQE